MKTILQKLTDLNPEAVIICGFDNCLVGTASLNGTFSPVAVYSTPKIIKTLIDRGLNEDEAWDHYYNKIETVDLGPHAPMMLNLESDEK